MVVTRKTPLVPPPPGPRSNGSQVTSRAAKGKDQLISTSALESGSGAGLSAVTGNANGQSGSSDVESPQKSKSKQKSKKDKKKNRKSETNFWDFLIRLLFISFAVYTFTVCPSDKTHESAVCRGLHKYRELILEPYIYPAFLRVIAHPSVAPYVEQVKPHIDTAVRVGTPIVYRAQAEWSGHVVPQWNKRIVPQWNKRVVPQWNKHVVPQWEKHVTPQLLAVEAKIEPYRSRAVKEYTRYSSRIGPHVSYATQKLHLWQRQAQPYVILAATKTHRGYQTARPYAVPLWNHFKAVLKQLLVLLREQRVLYVDPHVARIWEKVKELSSGKPVDTGAVVFEDAAAPTAAATLTHAETVAAEAMYTTASSSIFPEETQSTMSIFDESSTVASSASPTESAAESAVPAAVTSTFVTSSLIPDVTVSVNAPASASILDVVESVITTAHASASHSPSSSSIYATTGPSKIITDTLPTPDVTDFDLDEFTRELGLDEDVPEEEAVVVEDWEESEEEKAEKLRLKTLKTAQDRAAIEKRHLKWEADMDALIKGNTKKLKKKLTVIRKPAAEELKNSKDVKIAMDVLVSEADKYLKGGEVYLQTVKAESKKEADKLLLWNRVMDKINTKFQERLGEVDTIVNEWYMDILNQEVQELERLTKEVSDLSGEAQADLGMDYSWLGDVTYKDWQRYHDLARASENFTEKATAMQRGTDEVNLHNPITAILDDLEEELQDIVGGFETRLRGLRRDGERAISGRAEAPQPTASSSEPEFSILPVPEDSRNEEARVADIPPVVIGRSSEEVVGALKRAESAGISSHTISEEPADTVESLAHEASAEAGETVTSSIPIHAEL